MYSLIALFLITPLIFSHTFARLWEDFIIVNGIGHFESVKMIVFLVLIVTTLVEMSFTYRKELLPFLQRRYLQASIFTIYIIFTLFLYPYENSRDILFWVGEKQHGIFLALWLIVLYQILHSLSHTERRYIVYAVLASGCIVSLIALIEATGYNIFTGWAYASHGSWGSLRSASTLGNPNYVAGFLLMLLPLSLSLSLLWKYAVYSLLLLGIFMTQSIIGLSLAGMYLLYQGIAYFRPQQKYLIFFGIILFFLLGMYVVYFDTEKWLSFTSRFILMKYSLLASLHDVWGFLFGYGPNAIIDFFSLIRPKEVRAYFPDGMIIDSSHNLFIDIFSQYGLIVFSGIVCFLSRRWSHMSLFARDAIILWGCFLSLNVFVVSHMLLFTLSLSMERK